MYYKQMSVICNKDSSKIITHKYHYPVSANSPYIPDYLFAKRIGITDLYGETNSLDLEN